MNTRFSVILASLLVVATSHPNTCHGIDSRKVTSQARQAPEWVSSAASGYNDPTLGAGIVAPAVRDRNGPTNNPASPGWNDPLRPSAEPLRGSNNYNDPYFSQVVEQPQGLQKWRLGIYPEDTDTGVRITEVVRGSAAERAGLELNDRIISVHGYQVGYVNGVLYDCGQEFERHADDNGWVRVLVQNNRDGRLMNLPIQLDARQKAISGNVVYRDRSSLPRDAVLTVELRELIRSDLRPITLARQSFRPGRQVPIPFTLEYDPTIVDSRRNYVLFATIEGDGQLLYTTRQDIPVLRGGPSTDVQLLVERTGTSGGGNFPNRNEQLEQITRWFREYLRREPRSQELYVWEAHLARGGSLADAQLQILSTPEFYYQSNADDTQFIRRMFQLVTERQPSPQEISQWLNRMEYHHRIRPEVAREFLAMANAQAGRR